MRTSILVPPSGYAVTWDTCKQALRLEELGEQEDAEQALVMDTYLAAATKTATTILRRALLTTQYETTCYPRELRPRRGYVALELPWPDLQSVDLIQYGGADLVEDTDYRVAETSEGKPLSPGTIVFSAGLFGGACCSGSYGCNCDASLDDLASEVLRVQFTSGYGSTPEEIPADIRAWILLRTGALYQNREEITETRSVENLPFVDSLLMDRVFRFS